MGVDKVGIDKLGIDKVGRSGKIPAHVLVLS